MEHIEEAGIHSGDSACVLPPVTLSTSELERIRTSTEAIARGVGVRGLLNIQFALASDVLYVLEANPRATRTVPFVSKATGVPLAKAAALLMAGRCIAELRAVGILPATTRACSTSTRRSRSRRRCCRSSGSAPRRASSSTPCSARRCARPARSWASTSTSRPRSPSRRPRRSAACPPAGAVFISVADRDKRSIIFPVKRLAELGFEILATEGTAACCAATASRRPSSASTLGPRRRREPTIVDLINAGEVDMVVNTPSGQGARADGYEIRAATTAADKAIVTTVQQLAAAVQAIEARQAGPFRVTSLQEHDAAALAAPEARAAAARA